MAVTYATITRVATGPTPKRTFRFYPQTEGHVVTVAAQGYEHVGAYEVTTGAGGTFSVDIPLNTDQGGADLVWKITETPVDRIEGRVGGPLSEKVIGYASITASINYDDLIASLIDVIVVDPGLESSVAASAVTATTKAAEASGYADAALDSAANADSSADLAAVSEGNAASSASTATTQAGIATTKAGEAASSAASAAADLSDVEDLVGAATALAVSNDTIIAGRVNDPASATAVALSATTVAGVSLPKSNGTDDTAAVNAILTAHAGKTIKGVPGETYFTSTSWVIESGTTLDMTGCTVKMKVGARQSMLRNDALAGAGARDTNIAVIGGRWDKNGQTYDNSGSGSKFNGTGLAFHRIDGLTLRDATFTDGGAATKYAVGLGDVTRFYVGRLHMDTTNSDGVHILGPASVGVVENITGTTHDDMIAITARDYEDWTVGGSHDVTGVVIQNIFPAASTAAVKVLAGSGATVSGVKVRNIIGTTTNAGVYAVDDNFDADTTGGTWDDILIDGVDLTVGSGYAPVRVGMSAGTVGVVNIRNVTAPTSASRAVNLGNGGTNGTIGRITIDGITALKAHTDALVNVSDGTTIETLSIKNVRAVLKTDKTAGYVLNQGASGTITNLHLADIGVINGYALAAVGGTITRIKIGQTVIDATYGFVVSAAATTLTTAGGVTQVNGTFVLVSGTGALTLLGAGVELLNSAATFSKTASQTTRVNGVGFKVATSSLSGMAQDDIVYNIGAGSHGTGPVVVSGGGGIWRHLRTGLSNVGAPSMAAGAGAGTTPPTPAILAGSTDLRGKITFGTGTTPAAGVMATATFSGAYSAAPIVTIVPKNTATEALGLYVSATATGSFTVSATNAPAASQTVSTYAFDFVVTA